MNAPITLGVAVLSFALLAASGCAVSRGEESVSAYVNDTAITNKVKSRCAGNAEVEAAGIRVEALNGTVMLSGFAKSFSEKASADARVRP